MTQINNHIRFNMTKEEAIAVYKEAKENLLKSIKHREEIDNLTKDWEDGRDAMWSNNALNKLDRRIQKLELDIEYLELKYPEIENHIDKNTKYIRKDDPEGPKYLITREDDINNEVTICIVHPNSSKYDSIKHHQCIHSFEQQFKKDIFNRVFTKYV